MNSNNFLSDLSTIKLQKKNLITSDNSRKSIFYIKADINVEDKILRQRIENKKSINSENIKTLLRNVFGDGVAYKKIPDSTLHTVYSVSFNGKNYILKINRFSDIYHGLHLIQEQWINTLLEKDSLPSLKIIAVDVSRKSEPFDYIIMEKAKGKILHNRNLSKSKEKKIFIKLGEMIAKIHSLPTRNFGPLSFSEMIKTGKCEGLFTAWDEFFNLKLDDHLNACLNMKAISKSEKLKIKKIFSKNANMLKHIKPSIVHNDLSARNMFVDKNNLITLIDWEDAISGDPVYDIASFGTFCYRHEHSKRIEYFLNGYEKITKLPKDFEKKYWLYYLRIAILKTALLARQGNLNKEQSKRIQKAMRELI